MSPLRLADYTPYSPAPNLGKPTSKLDEVREALEIQQGIPESSEEFQGSLPPSPHIPDPTISHGVELPAGPKVETGRSIPTKFLESVSRLNLSPRAWRCISAIILGGKASPQAIATATGLPISRVYGVLRKLREGGLVFRGADGLFSLGQMPEPARGEEDQIPQPVSQEVPSLEPGVKEGVPISVFEASKSSGNLVKLLGLRGKKGIRDGK